MSGHSKWSTIKRKKAATDAKRGKVFTKLLKEIQIAAKFGGGSPEGNPRLKAAILSAKSMSVPGDNIERAIKRGTGDLEGVDYEEVMYEGYGPGGVALIISSLTDNRNRTSSDVKHILSKYGGNMGGANSVAYLFQQKGVIVVIKEGVSEEKLMELALEAGAEDIVDSEELWEIITDLQQFESVKEAVEKSFNIEEADLQYIPLTKIAVIGENSEKLEKLLEGLEDLDDVQRVVSNAE
jgi:YebC/PmpR family DNA-binding regulatory protein